jgi:hypothetical protein
MSSTNRGTKRKVNDFYPTPRNTIELLLNNHIIQYPVLEPCAGEGAIVRLLNRHELIYRNDIDKKYDNPYHLDAGKQWHPDWKDIKTVITNPPFNIALSVINNSLEHIGDGADVIMLLRLNFLGSDERKSFFNNNPPYKIFVLTKRPKFYHGKTDSIEYAWFVWKKGYIDKMVSLDVL